MRGRSGGRWSCQYLDPVMEGWKSRERMVARGGKVAATRKSDHTMWKERTAVMMRRVGLLTGL